jgi:glucose/mannose-6-phosphate isomerase
LLFDIKTLQKYDKESMYKIYDDWPKLAEKSYEFENQVTEFKQIKQIVFAGMGGSGTVGDIFSSILSCTNIQVDVVKGYRLPKTVSKNTLIITTSVSGNTAETITILENAINKKMNIIAFSSGGKMIELCKKNNITHKIIPQKLNPRSSLIVYLYSMLKVLNKIIPITEKEIELSIKQLIESKKNIYSENLTSNNLSLKIAKSLGDIPLIYFPAGLSSAAIRFKNSLQENSKTHVIAEDIIESCHNGIVAWEKISKQVKPILIQGYDDNIHTKKHWKILKNFFNEKNVEYNEIQSLEGDILTKIINLIYVLDYASIYVAIINKTNPFSVEPINFIKKRI